MPKIKKPGSNAASRNRRIRAEAECPEVWGLGFRVLGFRAYKGLRFWGLGLGRGASMTSVLA